MSTETTLSDALAALGISHKAHDHGRRALYRGEQFLGFYYTEDAWKLVHDLSRPAEDLTPEGIQLVIPGAERRPLPTTKQGELF